MSDTRAILVIGPAWVGDMVMAQVLFRLLKQQQPDASIDVLAPAWSEPLLARMPEVRASFDLPLKHGEFGFAARKKIGHSLRGKYQQAILLPNSWKSALVPFFADIPLRTGWRGEMRFGLLNDIRTLDKEKYPLMIERFSALAYPQNTALPAQLPRPHLAIKADELAAALQKYQLSVDAHILALCRQKMSLLQKRSGSCCPNRSAGIAMCWQEKPAWQKPSTCYPVQTQWSPMIRD